MALAGETHGNALLVGLADRILVTHRAARLHDGRHAVLGGQRHAVVEGEEAVRRQHDTLRHTGGTRLIQRQFGRTDAVHLSGADA